MDGSIQVEIRNEEGRLIYSFAVERSDPQFPDFERTYDLAFRQAGHELKAAHDTLQKMTEELARR